MWHCSALSWFMFWSIIFTSLKLQCDALELVKNAQEDGIGLPRRLSWMWHLFFVPNAFYRLAAEESHGSFSLSRLSIARSAWLREPFELKYLFLLCVCVGSILCLIWNSSKYFWWLIQFIVSTASVVQICVAFMHHLSFPCRSSTR